MFGFKKKVQEIKEQPAKKKTTIIDLVDELVGV